MDTPQLIIIHDTHKFRLSHVAGPAYAEIGPVSDTLAGTHSMQTYRRISAGYSGNPKRARTLTMPGSHTVDGTVAAHESGLDGHVQHRLKICLLLRSSMSGARVAAPPAGNSKLAIGGQGRRCRD